jgi:hypothetical protein
MTTRPEMPSDLRLFVLCEDKLHQRFVERLAERFGIGPRRRWIDASPKARGSAADYVIDHYVGAIKRWRSASHDENVGLLVVIDGDKKGVGRRRHELAERLKEAHADPVKPADRAAIIIPTWHVETWIAWLCGHRPIDERTRYKPDNPEGASAARSIQSGDYSPRRAVDAWMPPDTDEPVYVPSITDARRELSQRLGV